MHGRATNLKGYIVEVTGYADTTGSAAIDTNLSEKRAKAAVMYLFPQCTCPCGILWRRARWESPGRAATNETKAGDAPKTAELK